MKLDNFYHLEFLDYCLHFRCYTRNVLADASFDMKHLKKAEGRLSRNIIKYNNEDEDNSPITLSDNYNLY